MSAACAPPPPIRSSTRTSTGWAPTGLSRVALAHLLGLAPPFGAAVSSAASGRPHRLAAPTPASRHHLTSVWNPK